MFVCVHTVSGGDAQSQGVPGPPQDLGQVSVLQTSDRSTLHSLQLVSGLNLPAASRRAAAPHRHEPVRHQGGGCRGGHVVRHQPIRVQYSCNHGNIRDKMLMFRDFFLVTSSCSQLLTLLLLLLLLLLLIEMMINN